MENSTIAGQLLPGSSSTTLDLDSSFNFLHRPNDEEYDSFSFDNNLKQESQWHRMRWTDNMVRLLVAIVAFINDEGTADPTEAVALRQSILQKKGKWKSVSKLMMDKGFYVSPQQCEDKFNDLNKRYKRLNEILGRGTTCMVVENPGLLVSMTHVSLKMKEDVRKILGSKHLFYKEMCAYHNGQRIPDSQNFGLGSEILADSEDGDDDDDDDGGGGEGRSDELLADIDLVFQDKERTDSEKLDWFQRRGLKIREERLAILSEALELEKRSFKWQRFRSKKDREMEKMRLENERLMKENERMILELRHKEMEFTPWRLREARDPAAYKMDVEH